MSVAKLTATFLSLFPESTRSIVQASILGRALSSGILEVYEESIRDHALDKRKTVDDSPCGGGPGQLMKIDVVVPALRAALAHEESRRAGEKHSVRIILPDPAGKLFTQGDAKRLSQYDHLVFVCGRYEGIDARIHHYVDETLSIGDYVITGGELAALVMFDAIARHVPGVLGNEQSGLLDSHGDGLLEASQYTRPIEFDDHRVPDEFVGGNHQKIQEARRTEQLLRTQRVRPDLFAQLNLSSADQKLLKRAQDHDSYPWDKSSR